MMNKVNVSVVVVSRRFSKLKGCIESLLSQSYKDKEIIVVWNGSKADFENLKELYTKKEKVTFIKDGSNNVSLGRNKGIESAEGKYVAFTDDDCVLDHRWLEYLTKGFESKSKVAGVGSIRDVMNKDNFYANLWQLTNIKLGNMQEKYDSFNENNIYLCTSSAIFKREVLLKLNGFDEKLSSGEDSDISVRIKNAGYTLKMMPSAKIYHYHPETISQMVKQQLWYGYGDYFLYKKHHWDGFLNTSIRITSNIIFNTYKAFIYSLKLNHLKTVIVFPIYTCIMEIARACGYVKGYAYFLKSK